MIPRYLSPGRPPRTPRARREEITVEHVRALLKATANSVRSGAMLALGRLR